MRSANRVVCIRLSQTSRLAIELLKMHFNSPTGFPMQLEMKSRCEKCGAALQPDGEAYICSYECTFCPTCGANAHTSCPNCGGELIRRPRRSAALADHPIPAPPATPHKPSWRIWAVSFAVWAFLVLAATGTIFEMYRSTGRANFRETFFLQLCQILPYAPLTPFVFALAMRYPLQRGTWVRRSLLHLAAGVAFSAAHVAMRAATPYAVWDQQSRSWTSALWNGNTHTFKVRWPQLEMLFYGNVLDDITGAYLPVVFIAQAMSYYQRLRERESRTSQLEIQLAKSRLQVLKSQLQPHFLFNTLHSISALMLTDPRAADKMMTRLSDLLRMTLENNATQLTTLDRELEFLNGYLEIEKIRFEDKLTVELEIAPNTLDALVPTLLLQPLAENAVKHGISRQSEGGQLRIEAAHDDRNLYLTISNSGGGLGDSGRFEPKQGLGLRATRERLKTLYGGDQSLDIRQLPDHGVEVCVRIPFHTDPSLLMYEPIPELMEAAEGESSDNA